MTDPLLAKVLATIDTARRSKAVALPVKDVFAALADLLAAPAPPVSTAWAWDATKATVDPNSAALVQAFCQKGGLPAFLNAGNAVVNSTTADPGYALISPQGTFDQVVHIPAGTKPGCDDDGHLTILGEMREHDLYKAEYDAHQGRWMAGGGGSFQAGAVQETVAGNSNAACFPLARGLLRPEDLLPGAKPHPLVISCNAALLGGPVRYPARGQPGPTGPLAFGMWFRFPPTMSIALPPLEAVICRFIQACGLLIRDGGSPINICAMDMINQGGNHLAWGRVGVALPTLTAAGYPYAQQLSTAIPWAKLQALVPPSAA